MVYVKLEKLHNTQNVNIKYFRNMPKTDIHPNWFENATVYCDGKPICTVGSTKKELQVDIWLANHPFYNTSSTMIDTEGRVERFMKKYGLNSTN